jgi:hypothetical protein
VFQPYIITISRRNKVAFGGLPGAGAPGSGLHKGHDFEGSIDLQPAEPEVATVLQVHMQLVADQCRRLCGAARYDCLIQHTSKVGPTR